MLIKIRFSIKYSQQDKYPKPDIKDIQDLCFAIDMMGFYETC